MAFVTRIDLVDNASKNIVHDGYIPIVGLANVLFVRGDWRFARFLFDKETVLFLQVRCHRIELSRLRELKDRRNRL